MYGTGHLLRKIYSGQSLARVLANCELGKETISGRVVDVGGGRNPDYFEYLKKEGDVQIEALDGSISGIDFEVDALPFGDGEIDTVLLCNILEHLYRHDFLLRETHRVTRLGGKLIGFVPFWVGYHPDPHDYFRYTNEALIRMLSEAGWKNVSVRPIAVGPILANFNTIMLSFPRWMRPGMYLWYALWNKFFVMLRPRSVERNPLGYIFTAHA